MGAGPASLGGPLAVGELPPACGVTNGWLEQVGGPWPAIALLPVDDSMAVVARPVDRRSNSSGIMISVQGAVGRVRGWAPVGNEGAGAGAGVGVVGVGVGVRVWEGVWVRVRVRVWVRVAIVTVQEVVGLALGGRYGLVTCWVRGVLLVACGSPSWRQ